MANHNMPFNCIREWKVSSVHFQTSAISWHELIGKVQCVPLATEPGISLIILPLMRILKRNLKRTYLIVQTHSFSFLIQRTYSCKIFIGVRIIKEMPGSVASGTHCINHPALESYVSSPQISNQITVNIIKETTFQAFF